jgi:hypothetical protein
MLCFTAFKQQWRNNMGWSCTQAADDTIEKINSLVQSQCPNVLKKYRDQLPGGFFEINRAKEHEDGSITGSVFKFVEGNKCSKVGSFKINPNGTIGWFPMLPLAIKKAVNDPILKVKMDRVLKNRELFNFDKANRQLNEAFSKLI